MGNTLNRINRHENNNSNMSLTEFARFASASRIFNNSSPLRILQYVVRLDATLLDSRDREGNTPLHLSIDGSKKILDYLLKQPNILIDEVNLLGQSALILAAMNDKEAHLSKLIKKGANINLVDNSGCSALHYAVSFSSTSLCHDLIKNGIDVNLQNLKGETALHLACRFNPKVGKISMLLYHGADPLISCEKGYIPILMDNFNILEMDLRRMLFYYTHKCDLEMKILVRAMIMKSPMFNLILNEVNKVIYNEADLYSLNECLPDIELPQFELFFNKFHYIIRDMLTLCCTLANYLTAVESMKRAPSGFVNFLQFLLNNHLVTEVIQSSCQSTSTISSLVKIFHKNKFPLERLTELVCLMLSHGIRMTATDLNAVYVYYGRCELFRMMLHMDIETIDVETRCCELYDYEVVQESIIAHFIYDINLNLRTFLDKPQWLLSMDLDMLLNYFADPKLQDFFLTEGFNTQKVQSKLQKLPTVPSLTDLARNVARGHIIKRFNIKSCKEFYTAIKWLPIGDIYKKILTYERKLYDV